MEIRSIGSNFERVEKDKVIPTPRRRWRIAWLLGLGVLINYFDRVNLSVSHNALNVDFGISDITFGYLLGAYNWSYALCQLPMGVVLDKFGVRRVGSISTLIWSIACFAAAMAQGIGGLFSARFLLGLGESPAFPAYAKAVGSWFPVEERSFATSLYDSAAKFAPAIGVPLIGILLLHVGWRLSFAATGVVSFLYFVLFFWMYREPEKDARLSMKEFALIRARSEGRPHDSEDRLASLGFLLRQRKVLGLAPRIRLLQLHLLSSVDMAAELFVGIATCRFTALVFVHGITVVGSSNRRTPARWMAR